MSFVAELSIRFSFEAAHYMTGYPEGHPNRTIHGHSYTGEVILKSAVDPKNGMVMEFEELSSMIKGVTKRLDHKLLNEIPGLEVPTGEYLARWIYLELKPGVKGLQKIIVKRETVGISVSYSGEELQG